MPATVKTGEHDYVILDCDYEFEDTSKEGLVVKWFFQGKELMYQWIQGRDPQADESVVKYVDLTYKVSDDPYTEYRAIKLDKPGIDLTGEYTCVVSTHEDEKTANASMVVYCEHFISLCILYDSRIFIPTVTATINGLIAESMRPLKITK